MKQIGHFIDGELVPGNSGRQKDIYNPNTGDIQAQVNLATPKELDAAVASAAKAQVLW
ncbi:MAG: methylmalonate-semialdehyde dehydrogenase (CoA acylating), partial [Hellea sp.]|nr:methylmalonate-semialdehyde dehydrogenase (CoA acylating) [Hellea sp.]